MNQTIKDEIEQAIVEYESKIGELDYSSEQKEYGLQLRSIVTQLINVSETIRAGCALTNPKSGKGWRYIEGFQRTLLVVGQSLSNVLLCLNLRDNITDKIECAYGISFNSLRIHPGAINKETGELVYVLNYRGMSSSSYTIVLNGELRFVSIDEFASKYTITPYV